MALKGEGDSRWIVTEREDGANVHGWHWTEKDVSKQSKTRLQELFGKGTILFDDEVGVCKVTKVKKCEGDAVLHNRKGKRKSVYEWTAIDVEYQADLLATDDDSALESTGHFRIRDFDNHDVDEETKIRFIADKNGKSDKNVAAHLKKVATSVVQDLLDQYVVELTTGEGDSELAKACSDKRGRKTASSVETNTSSSGGSSMVTESVSSSSTSTSSNSSSTSTTSGGKNFTTQEFTQKIKFNAPVSEVFQCLIDIDRVQAYTQSEAKIVPEVNGEFSIYGGQIHGDFEEYEANVKFVQRWRFKDWPKDHFSTVTMEFEDSGSQCTVKLTQTGIPTDDYERTSEGWDRQIWDRIRKMFGFNVVF